MTVFLSGDVMTGRGVDQILPRPSDPHLREEHVRDARTYVELAEAVSGPIPRPVEVSYVWGDALGELERVAPAARVANLECSVTKSDEYWRRKGIHYRMHPENVPCLVAAGIDVWSLANNHVLDYGYPGLLETLETLRKAGLKTAGAGRTLAEAQEPVVLDIAGLHRLLVFAFGSETSGIPPSWAATDRRAGIDVLADLSEATAAGIQERVLRVKRTGDIVVASIHWGSNWGFEVAPSCVRFARWLIDGGVDIVHGHSSHHPRRIEVYRNKLVLYGCGDFIDDYEGISGYEPFRNDLVLMYFATIEPSTGELVMLRMTPMKIERMRLTRASRSDTEWLGDTLDRICGHVGSRVELADDGTLALRWGRSQ